MSDIGGEIDELEESNINDGSVDESYYDQVEANTAIGRENCTVWYNEGPRTRRNVRKNVPREIAGVHVEERSHYYNKLLSSKGDGLMKHLCKLWSPMEDAYLITDQKLSMY